MRMGESKHTLSDLYQMQSLPLSAKIRMTEYRIRQWYETFEGNVYVSFSGGKDSTVLLNIARRLYPDIEAVFVNTGLEYPSVRKFALSKENVTELRPEISFRNVVSNFGYPIISKRIAGYVNSAKNNKNCMRAKYLKGEIEGTIWGGNGKYWFLIDSPFKISEYCCNAMKKTPVHKYQKQTGKKPILGTMACESKDRQTDWIHRGCNTFDRGEEISRPISFWTENDILSYIHEYNLEIAEVYGNIVVDNKEQIDGQITIQELLGDYTDCKFCTTGCKRTGCIFCLFGITQDLFRIYNLQKQEPKLADYVLRGGEFSDDGMWQPSKNGMGYWFVLDWLEMHGIYIPYTNAEHYRTTYGNEHTMELLKQAV